MILNNKKCHNILNDSFTLTYFISIPLPLIVCLDILILIQPPFPSENFAIQHKPTNAPIIIQFTTVQ